MERFNEPQPERASARTPESAYEEVLRDPEIYRHYEGLFKEMLRELQLRNNDLNFPLNERQVEAFIMCMQRALDSGICGDDAIEAWAERHLRLIKKVNERRKRSHAQAAV
jgi:hypothetical protein